MYLVPEQSIGDNIGHPLLDQLQVLTKISAGCATFRVEQRHLVEEQPLIDKTEDSERSCTVLTGSSEQQFRQATPSIHKKHP